MSDQKKILKYCNLMLYTDIQPFEVVHKVSDKCVEVRRMDTEVIIQPRNFESGGFSAICIDNHNQQYKYISNPNNPIIRVRWSERKKTWQVGKSRFMMSTEPIKFYDYNF